MPDEILEKAVLPVLGGPRICLNAEHLLAHERLEQRLELLGLALRQRRQRLPRESLAEHGSVFEHPPLRFRETVQPCGDESVQRLGHLERLDGPGQLVRGPFLDDQAAVEQHSNRLDRIQRHTFRTTEDLVTKCIR